MADGSRTKGMIFLQVSFLCVFLFYLWRDSELLNTISSKFKFFLGKEMAQAKTWAYVLHKILYKCIFCFSFWVSLILSIIIKEWLFFVVPIMATIFYGIFTNYLVDDKFSGSN